MKINTTTVMFFLVFLLLFWGGLGISLETTAALGIVFCVMLFAFWDILKGSKGKPLGFDLYLAFLVVVSVPLFTGRLGEQGKYLLMLFLGGGAFWLVFYNLKKIFSDKFSTVVILLGIVFGLMLARYMLLGRVPEGPWNLYLFSTVYRNHNHIGDLWALVEIAALYKLIKTRRWYWWLLGLAGIFFLAVSLSRSAYVAFFAGAAFLAYRENWFKKYSKLLIPVLVVPILLFWGVGLFKTTLYSRGYFIQGILGFIKYPLGVGLGNFGQVSNEMGNILNVN